MVWSCRGDLLDTQGESHHLIQPLPFTGKETETQNHCSGARGLCAPMPLCHPLFSPRLRKVQKQGKNASPGLCHGEGTLAFPPGLSHVFCK